MVDPKTPKDRGYRIVDYDNRWYPEVQSSQGVWQILGNFDTKEEAEEKLNQVKEENETI